MSEPARGLLLAPFVLAACAASRVQPQPLEALDLPAGTPGIGFDDLQFAPELGRLLVPAGRTGTLLLVEPSSREIRAVSGFTASLRYEGGHGEGTTSAVFGSGWIFAIDRSSQRLDVVDPVRRAIVAYAPLSASPDYVRWVEPTREIWVTEPDAEQIEVFALPASGGPPVPERRATIRVAGGPESLVIDTRRRRAYTQLWKGITLAIDLDRRTIAATWPNGCAGSRGIALDAPRGWLFAACDEGRAVTLDVDQGGRPLGRLEADAGIDVIAYSPARRHLYLPSARTGTLTVARVTAGGALQRVAEHAIPRGAHCVAADDQGRVWVCDPGRGRLLTLRDAP